MALITSVVYCDIIATNEKISRYFVYKFQNL
jgi:hypothetical protein